MLKDKSAEYNDQLGDTAICYSRIRVLLTPFLVGKKESLTSILVLLVAWVWVCLLDGLYFLNIYFSTYSVTFCVRLSRIDR